MKRKSKKPKFKRYWIPIGISLVMISVFFIFQNGTCNQAGSEDNTIKKSSNSVTPTNTGPSPLNLFASSSSVVVEKTLQFSATGGTQPYTFFALSGAGTMNQLTGVYTAGSVLENGVEIGVQDANGKTASTYINVIAAPTPTPTPVPGSGITLLLTTDSTNVLTEDRATLTVTNGTPPYQYTLLSGGGSLNYTAPYFSSNNNTARYTAPNYAGNATIQVSDSLSNTGKITLNVVNFPMEKVSDTYSLTIDQYFGITYSFPSDATYPKLTAWGMSSSFNAGVNCFPLQPALPCVKEYALTNFKKADKLQTSYRGIIGFYGRGGSVSVDYCIPYDHTDRAYVKQANGGTLNIFYRRYLASTSSVMLFDGAYAITGNYEIDKSSGAGIYTLTFTGQYSVKKDCSDIGTNYIQLRPL